MAPKYKVSRPELLQRLQEHLGFIVRSAAEFDKGETAEGRRIAVSLRVLFHNTRQSRALLWQLGFLPEMSFIDTCGDIVPGNLAVDHPMVAIRMSDDGAVFVPMLGNAPPVLRIRKKPFERWWNDSVISHAPSKTSFNRRELVTLVANQDGGAHVDPEIDARYARLTRAGDPGWMSVRGGVSEPIRPIELAHIRQIAYEVLLSLQAKPGLSGTAAP